MVKLEHLSFYYENEENNCGIQDVSFHLQKGSCTVLCGMSGCGKTTLLRLISGLIPAYFSGEIKGKIEVNGKNPVEMDAAEKALTFGMVFQDPRSQFFMPTVLNEIAFSGENLGIERTELLHKLERITSQLGLTDLKERDLNSLSSGQKQKVAIAVACLLNPPLLILDEPTANLDHEGTGTLIEILTEIKNNGSTILISEHRLHCFLPIADRYLCLEQGRLANCWSQGEFEEMTLEEAEKHGLRHPDSGKKSSVPSCTNMDDLLVGKEVGFHYAHQASLFHRLDFSLSKGSVMAIVGKNGKGKTTFGKILCGLLKQKSGKILYRDKPISASKRCRNSYFVMQDADYQLYAESVGNELVLGKKVTSALKKKAYAAMELFDLTALKDRHPASLSGGEKQRVTLAAAYCSDAEIIVMDEPTSGLDAINAKRVAKFIRLLSSSNKTVLVITHDELLIRLACDSTILIE